MNRLLKYKFLIAFFAVTSFIVSCTEENEDSADAVTAGFTYTIDAETGTVTFLNTSENATTYSWDFGDETSSRLKDPVKMYSANGTYNVLLTASNEAGRSDVESADIVIEVVIPDTEAPVITLLGDAVVSINVGDTFTDPGATANDNADGDLTSAIVVTGTVDTDTEGSYKLDYNVSDAAGNAAATVSRTVNVGTSGGGSCVAETEETLSANGFNWTFQTDPTANVINDGGNFSWIDNPDADNAINTSCKVGQITKTGANPWDNTQLVIDSKIDFNTYAGFKIKVWSGKANTKVLIKLEDKDVSGTNAEVEASMTKTSEWEELTVPFDAAQSGKFDRIVLFFDLNGNNTDTYYFDDLMLYTRSGGGGGNENCIAETTETLSATGFNWTFQTDPTASVINDGGNFSWIDNPDFDNSVNGSCKVGQITKTGANPWDNTQYVVDSKIDFNAYGGFKVKVWSGKADTKVLLKLEDKDAPGTNKEVPASMTKTSEWEELTFSFDAGDAGKFDRIVLFFDLNANNTDTYYFDDLMLYTRTGGGGGGGGDCPEPPAGQIVINGDFETGNDCGWGLFANGGVTEIDNTMSNGGGSYSLKIAANGPGNPGAKQERIGVGTIQAGNTIRLAFDHIGSTGGEGGVFNVLLFVERAEGETGDPITHVFDPRPNLSDTWSRFNATYTIPAGASVSGGVSFLIESVCGGAAGCTVSANIDNVSLTID